MNNDTCLLLPVVAVTGSSILVGCGGGYSNAGCSYGSYGYGSYGSFGSYGGTTAEARPHTARAAHRAQAALGPYYGCYNPSPVAGIYEGTLRDQASQQQTPVVAIIADDGEARISGQNATYYRLNVFSSGYSASGSFSAYSQGPDFANGTLTTSGSFSAAPISAGLNVTLTLEYNDGDSATLALKFDQTYNAPSALSMLAGSWTYTSGSFTLNASIQSNGTLSGTDSNSCTYSGDFSLIDETFDAYDATYTLTCNGVNQTYSGLASYFPATLSAPAQIKLYADDQTGGFLAATLQPTTQRAATMESRTSTSAQ